MADWDAPLRSRGPIRHPGRSYENVARTLDQIAEVPRTGGVLLAFGDFVECVENFGTRIQPLMKSRQAGHGGLRNSRTEQRPQQSMRSARSLLCRSNVGRWSPLTWQCSLSPFSSSRAPCRVRVTNVRSQVIVAHSRCRVANERLAYSKIV